MTLIANTNVIVIGPVAGKNSKNFPHSDVCVEPVDTNLMRVNNAN